MERDEEKGRLSYSSERQQVINKYVSESMHDRTPGGRRMRPSPRVYASPAVTRSPRGPGLCLSELGRELDDVRSTLEGIQDGREKGVNLLKERIRSQQDATMRSSEELSRRKREILQLKDRMDTLTNELKERETLLRQREDDLRACWEEKEKTTRELRKELANKDDKIQELELSHISKYADNNPSLDETNSLALSMKDDQIGELIRRVEELEHERTVFLRGGSQVSMKKIDKMRTTIDKQDLLLSELQKHNDALRNSRAEVIREKDSLLGKMGESKRKNGENANLAEKSKRLTSRCTELEDIVRERDVEISSLTGRIRAMELKEKEIEKKSEEKQNVYVKEYKECQTDPVSSGEVSKTRDPDEWRKLETELVEENSVLREKYNQLLKEKDQEIETLRNRAIASVAPTNEDFLVKLSRRNDVLSFVCSEGIHCKSLADEISSGLQSVLCGSDPSFELRLSSSREIQAKKEGQIGSYDDVAMRATEIMKALKQTILSLRNDMLSYIWSESGITNSIEKKVDTSGSSSKKFIV